MNRYGRHTLAAFDAQMRAPLPALDATEGPQEAPKVLRGHGVFGERWIVNKGVAMEDDKRRNGAHRGSLHRCVCDGLQSFVIDDLEMVDQTFTSWNPPLRWLRGIEALLSQS
jgi:hypothetical protein